MHPPQLIPIVGHVVGGRPPDIWSWVTVFVLFGGIAIAILVSSRWARIAMIAVALAGLGGAVADLVSRYQRPRAPHIKLLLASPGHTSSPGVLVHVCGMAPHHRRAHLMAGGRLLLVRVDGVQMAEVHSTTVTIQVPPGRHELFAEVNNRYHQEYDPPLRVVREIRVEASGSVPEQQPCGR